MCRDSSRGPECDSRVASAADRRNRNARRRRSRDIADLIVYLVTRPPHVNISTLDIVPTRQA
jgi:NADP-dependent 3-hydroxy acid dehydrogenase YdfG